MAGLGPIPNIAPWAKPLSLSRKFEDKYEIEEGDSSVSSKKVATPKLDLKQTSEKEVT